MESLLPQLRCCCCGGPHLNGDCETYSYCDLCGKDLVYCSCEPERVLIIGSYPWLAQPKILEEPECIVIDKSYHWLADDWLADEQPLNQSNQPQLLRCGFCEGNHLNGYCEPSSFTSDSEQEEQGLIIEESWEKRKDEEEKRIEREDPLVWKEDKNSQSWGGMEIQQETTQQMSFSTHLLRSKEEGSEEIDRYLDSFYALFIILHLERVWKHIQLYLKFMNFLPHKRKKKDDVFFVSYIPP